MMRWICPSCADVAQHFHEAAPNGIVTKYYVTKLTTKSLVASESRPGDFVSALGDKAEDAEHGRGFVPGHIDNPPQNAITAEEVRNWPGDYSLSVTNHEAWKASRAAFVFAALLTHPGVSSAARAVIEAALE